MLPTSRIWNRGTGRSSRGHVFRRRTADAIPGARYRTLPGAGHLSTLERPDLVTEMLREHLDGILEI